MQVSSSPELAVWTLQARVERQQLLKRTLDLSRPVR